MSSIIEHDNIIYIAYISEIGGVSKLLLMN